MTGSTLTVLVSQIGCMGSTEALGNPEVSSEFILLRGLNEALRSRCISSQELVTSIATGENLEVGLLLKSQHVVSL